MEIQDEVIVLKSVYGKTPGQKFYITPCPNPKTGMYAECVRAFDEATHQLILSEADKTAMYNNGAVFIPRNQPIEIVDGQTFHKSIPMEWAVWQAIQYSPLIAHNRGARNAQGDLLIDGTKPTFGRTISKDGIGITGTSGHYGIADLYVYKPGAEKSAILERKKLVARATRLVEEDSLEGRVRMCKLLEKNMIGAPAVDVEAYLWDWAEKDPKKIIDLYTGGSAKIRLLLITAMEKGVVIKRNGLLLYGEDGVPMGTSLDAAVTILQQPQNDKLRELITRDTFPEMYEEKKETSTSTKTNKK